MTPYARALRETMDRRGVGVVALAEAVGLKRQSITNYLTGQYLPRATTGHRIAEALDSSRLYGILQRARATTCGWCGIVITSAAGGGATRKWCSATCRDRSRYGRMPRQSAERIAIAEMCRSCEPAGVCYQAECPLRRYSPFALVGDVMVPLADPDRRQWSQKRRAAS